MVHKAVSYVHPLETNSSLSCDRLLMSIKVLLDVYAIMMIGITISLAGNPRMNAIRITPSSPIKRANGSRKSEQMASGVVSPTRRFAISQISIPAGIAVITALPRTKAVLSKIDRIITLPH